jgi:hypothetical protein
MLHEFYKEIALILFNIGWVVIALILSNIILQWSLCYINDKTYRMEDYITEKFIDLCPLTSETDKRWIHENRSFGWSLPLLFINICIIALSILIWPIAVTALTFFGILWTLRSGNRVRKNVSKLNKVAHDHDGKDILRFK